MQVSGAQSALPELLAVMPRIAQQRPWGPPAPQRSLRLRDRLSASRRGFL